MIVVRYACLMRPPEPGAVPRDGLHRVCMAEMTAPSGHHAWGWAEYTRVLRPDEAKHYDLECMWKKEVVDDAL